MKTINFDLGDLLVIDPGYIKNVSDGVDSRFDALRCVRVLHEGDDGGYTISVNNKDYFEVGVDSGRIWVLEAEFSCKVEIEAGMSGFRYFPNGTAKPDNFQVVGYEYE